MPVAFLLSLCLAGDADKPDRATIIQDARQVVAAVVSAAKENRGQAKPMRDDALMELYVRTAAKAASKLPKERAGRAFALGLGVAVDPSSMVRNNPVVALTWRRVETGAERQERLKVIGEASIHGRHDLGLHFVVSVGLTEALGEKGAEAAGLMKELMDARDGGSGFSFADLAADYAGVAFARRVIEQPERLEAIAKGFQGKDFALPAKGLVEGLRMAEFEKRFGGTGDERFRKEVEEIRKRIAALPGFQEK